MKNKIVGYLIIGIALVIGFIIYSFNRALTDIVNTTCSHGPSCPMWGTIRFQTNIGIGIMVFVILIGLYFVFLLKEEKTGRVEGKVIKAGGRAETSKRKGGDKKESYRKASYQKIMRTLGEEEKKVFREIKEAEGAIFQSEIVEKTGLSKVKITRILDRLEGRGLVERKRRGMTNVVIMKQGAGR